MKGHDPENGILDVSPMGGTSARVADHLRQAILRGEFRAGEPIRQETLAKQLGASRLPVREALRTLEGEGLVTLEPNKGARVTSLDATELSLLYDTRARIEPLVMADSLPHLSESTIVSSGRILDQIEAGVSLPEFLVLDRRYHLMLYQGCQSTHLLSIVERLWNSTQQYRRAFGTATGPRWIDDTNSEHRLLHAAVTDRNAQIAASILATHITRTQVALRRAPNVFVRETGLETVV